MKLPQVGGNRVFAPHRDARRDWQRAQQTLVTHIQDCVTQMASVMDAAAASG